MSSKQINQDKMKKILDLLKFSLTLDDEEILKAAVEAVIEILEEETS